MPCHILRLLALIPLVLVLTACLHDDDNDDDGDDDQDNFSINLVLKDQFDQEEDTFVQGDPVTFELSITNDGSETETLTFGGCLTDISVMLQGGDEVWSLSNDVVCLEVVQNVTLDAGETRIESYEWDQMDDSDSQIAQGDYDVSGFFLYQGAPEIAAAAELHIQ